METKLPLVVVQGSFKVLERLDCTELEVFLRYVISFIKKRRIKKSPSAMDEDFRIRPFWWTQKVPYPSDFISGAPIPYVRDKELKLRRLVKSVYNYYHCKDLLDLSDKFAATHACSYYFRRNANNSLTVYQNQCQSPIVTIPHDNLDYDFRENPKPEVTIHSKEVNTSLSEFIARPAVKKSPMKLIDSAKSSSLLKRQPPITITPIYILSDSDDEEVKNKENNGKGITMDSDTIVIEDSESEDDCQIVSITDILNRPLLLGLLPPKPTVKKKLNKIVQPIEREQVVVARKKSKRQIKKPKYFHDEDTDSSNDYDTIEINDDLADIVENATFDTIDKSSFLKCFQLKSLGDDLPLSSDATTTTTTTATSANITPKTTAKSTISSSSATSGRSSRDPSMRIPSDTRSRRRVASRLPYELFELELVERLVAVNHLPAGCLIDPEEEQKRTEIKIARYLRDIPQPAPITRTNSQGSYTTPPCWVQLTRLPASVIQTYVTEETSG